MKKKILFVEAGLGGGSVNRLQILLRNWPAADIPFDLFTFFNAKKAAQLLQLSNIGRNLSFSLPEDSNVDILKKIFGVPVITGHGMRYFLRAIKFILGGRYNVMYINNTPRSHLPLLLAAKFFRMKIICHLRDTIRFTRAERLLLGVPQKYAVLSHAAKEHYVREGLPVDRLEVVYDSIDLSHFSQPADVENSKTAVVVGSLSRRKGQDNCLRALQKVLAKQPDARLIMIGEGEVRNELEKLASDLGVEHSVSMPGHCENVHEQLRSVGFGILSSRREGFPNSVMEYMAAGLPVLVSDLPGIRELVEDDVSGFIHPIDGVSSLAEHWIKLLESSEMRERMGKRGRELIQAEEFTPHHELRKILDIVKE